MRAVCALFFCAAGVLPAQNYFDLVGHYWMPDLSATVRVERNGLGGDIDARRDLGMPNTDFFSGGFLWQHGRSRLRFEYTPIDYTGDQTVTRTILFAGRTYTFGTRVVSELEAQHLQLSWAYQFVNVHRGAFRIGPMIEADGFLLRGDLTAPDLSPPLADTEELSAGLPTIGLAMDIQPRRWIDIYGEAAGMKAGSYGSFVGSEAGVKVAAWGHLLLTAGYRTFNLQIESSQDFARFRLRGPFLGAGVRF